MKGGEEIVLIPKPKKCEGGNTVRSFFASVGCSGEFARPTAAFCFLSKKLYGIAFRRVDKNPAIVLELDEQMPLDRYMIDATGAQVVLISGGVAGMAYAFATLLQLLSKDGEKFSIPNVRIEDWPDCHYRGLMIDLARKEHSLQEVLEYVDLCFMYKISQLQLHLMDNERYMICSKVCPAASTKGYYTERQIAELVAYAYERNIELIPEFETPGHSNALIQAYPDIFEVETDVDNSQEFVINGRAIKHSVVCIGKSEALRKTKELIREIMELFPHSTHIHLGGDEVNIALWNECPLCREEMTRRGVSNEKEMYGLWMKDVTDFVLECGRVPIVWEGFPKESESLLSKDVQVMAWENYYNPMPGLLEQGFPIINCAWKPLYIVPIDRGWNEQTVLEWNIWNWQHWWKKSAAYPHGISIKPTEQVIGAQICVWECTYEEEIDRVRRMLAALSERTWNDVGDADVESFRMAIPKLIYLAKKLAEKSENK